MAKKVVNEAPYRPVNESLIRAVLNPQLTDEPSAKHQSPVLRDPSWPAAPPPSREPPLASWQKVPESGRLTRPVPALAPAPSVAEKFDREKRLLLTRSEERALDRLVAALALALDTPVKLSHVLRACTALLVNAEAEILRGARDAPPLIRPPNGDLQALSQFERVLSSVVAAALREARPLR